MTIENTISTIKRDLIRAFAVLDGWFDKDDAFHHYKPPPGDGLVVRDLLEHVMLTSSHMMFLLDNGGEEVLKQARTSDFNDYIFINLAFDDPAVLQFFTEIQVERRSIGTRQLQELRAELRDQLNRCLCHLELLNNGEGALYSMKLSTNGTDRIDLYQCINLIALHLWQHVEQLNKIEEEYLIQPA